MQIDINQKKISIGDKYQIYSDTILTHNASRELFRLLPVVNLYQLDSGRPVMQIRKKFSWFSARYDIQRWDNNILEFRTKSIWKLHYQCDCGFDRYDIYGHTGRKYSIFKNDIQVAWFTKKAVSWFAGDNYTIIADKESDADLIITFCLIIDNFRSDDHSNTINIDFGNIGFFARKFDDGWMPKG